MRNHQESIAWFFSFVSSFKEEKGFLKGSCTELHESRLDASFNLMKLLKKNVFILRWKQTVTQNNKNHSLSERFWCLICGAGWVLVQTQASEMTWFRLPRRNLYLFVACGFVGSCLVCAHTGSHSCNTSRQSCLQKLLNNTFKYCV